MEIFEVFPIVSLRGMGTGIPIFWARNRSKSRKNCCKLLHALFSPVLGGGLEPPRLTAYAPQTYVSAISPPERFEGTQLLSRTTGPASVSSAARPDGRAALRGRYLTTTSLASRTRRAAMTEEPPRY